MAGDGWVCGDGPQEEIQDSCIQGRRGEANCDWSNVRARDLEEISWTFAFNFSIPPLTNIQHHLLNFSRNARHSVATTGLESDFEALKVPWVFLLDLFFSETRNTDFTHGFMSFYSLIY